MTHLQKADPQVFQAIQHELKRQKNNLELIASENIVSPAVLEAAGSVLTNKYAEGYSGARWYNGCEFIDEVENLAILRAKELFGPVALLTGLLRRPQIMHRCRNWSRILVEGNRI